MDSTPARQGDDRAAPESSPDDRRSELVRSIYRLALEPMSYDSFMGAWDDYMAGRVAALASLSDSAGTATAAPDPDLEAHFEIASKLLAQSPPPPDGDAPSGETGAADPRMLVAADGRIVWSNAAATRLFALSRAATIEALDLPAPQAAALRERAASLSAEDGTKLMPALVLRVGAPGQSRPVDMTAQRVENADGPVLALAALAPRWTGSVEAILRDGFALTPGEIAVASLAAEGLSPAEIAAQRDASVATVRTQIKSILGKTRCGGQPALVRLLHALMRVAEEQGQEPASAPGVYTVRVSDRDMPVEEHGDPDGRPVIFLHGMLDGNAVTRQCRTLLEQAGLRLICPVRPRFGTAAPSPGAFRTAPQRLAADMLVLIERLRLDRPVLLGHMAGSVYAFATAAAAGDAVRGIVSVAGGVPILSPRQFAVMSARQRLVAYTARYAPQALPFVLRAGISQMKRGGARRFLHALYETSPHDMRLIGDPEVAEIVLDGYRFTVAQGHVAFEIDSHQVVRDWSALVEGSEVPVRLVHGAHDPVVSLASVRAFAQRHAPRARLTVLEDTGQLAFYKAPDAVIAAIEELYG